jgi:multidrug efflux pump
MGEEQTAGSLTGAMRSAHARHHHRLVAVFVPVSFSPTVGTFFREFGIMVAVAVAISGFVALTLSPMLCSKILRPIHGGGGWAARSFDAFFAWIDSTYARILDASIRHRAVTLTVAFLLVVGAVGIFRVLPRELAPTEDRGIAFGSSSPGRIHPDYTDGYMRQIEAACSPRTPGSVSPPPGWVSADSAVTNGSVFLNLKPRRSGKIQQRARPGALSPDDVDPGVLAFLINPPSLGGRFSRAR